MGAAIAVAVSVASGLMPAAADPTVVQEISSDPYTNVSSQHQTEVEPDTFSFGNTVVAAYQAGRFEDGGGSSNIGWATSSDAGTTWRHGFLPSLTVFSTPAGTSGRASDPSVGYDARHGAWLISSLVCTSTSGTCNSGPIAIVVSRSADGLNWGPPTSLGSGFYDKNWTACDNGASSPFFGRCYTSWIDDGSGLTLTSASTDGGVTWRSAVAATGMVGVQPVVQPDGTLIIVGMSGNSVIAERSTNGGASFGPAVLVSAVQERDPSGMRAPVLPSVAVDGEGTVYAVWPDCRLRPACSSNDIVMSSSADGITWSATPVRVPIDSTASNVDHFIPGLAVDPGTAGAAATIGIVYYYFPQASCNPDLCQLDVGFISSTTAGATWGAATQLNPHPMALSWLANTTWPGHMVGDYISTSFVGGRFAAVFSLASAPSGGVFQQSVSAAAIGVGSTPTPSPLHSPIPTPSPGSDSDGDGVPDTADNCPRWPNPTQALPPWPLPADDPDCDGFGSPAEAFVGTNLNLACGPNAWPPDLNNDLRVNVTDRTLMALAIKAYKANNVTGDNRRYDLNADGAINVTDRTAVALYIRVTGGLPCTP